MRNDRRPFTSLLRVRAIVALIAAWALCAAFVAGCARASCTLNSDCPQHSRCDSNRCVTECSADRDCPTDRPVCSVNGQCVAAGAGDAISPDATSADVASADVARDVPAPRDVPMTTDVPVVVDVPTVPDVPQAQDVPPPPPDVPPPGIYLDRCASDSDCASGLCSSGPIRFCTHRCNTFGECAHGQMCAANQCELDDTGAACDPSTNACRRYCLGVAGAAHCTRECTTASDCPAGYACSMFGAAKVCVNIERACTDASQCPSQEGFCGSGGLGCTANCQSASDCPTRLSGFPPYTCELNGGAMVCVPPSDVTGPLPVGATCTTDPGGACRSDACDTGVTPNTCTQACTTVGGCPPGYGCFPLADSNMFYLVCTAAGTGWLGDYCDRARDCRTGLCSSGHFCTRICDDGYCPSGMTCMDSGATATDGTRLALCSR